MIGKKRGKPHFRLVSDSPIPDSRPRVMDIVWLLGAILMAAFFGTFLFYLEDDYEPQLVLFFAGSLCFVVRAISHLIQSTLPYPINVDGTPQTNVLQFQARKYAAYAIIMTACTLAIVWLFYTAPQPHPDSIIQADRRVEHLNLIIISLALTLYFYASLRMQIHRLSKRRRSGFRRDYAKHPAR